VSEIVLPPINRRAAFKGGTLEHDDHFAELQKGKVPSAQELILRVFRDASIGLVITDHLGRFMVANDAFSRMTGYSHQELAGVEFASISLAGAPCSRS
jgi:PAS domain-containing protein